MLSCMQILNTICTSLSHYANVTKNEKQASAVAIGHMKRLLQVIHSKQVISFLPRLTSNDVS